jgi:hypothetical protein
MLNTHERGIREIIAIDYEILDTILEDKIKDYIRAESPLIMNNKTLLKAALKASMIEAWSEYCRCN